MPLTDAYLLSCRTAVEDSPEWTAFVAAGALGDDATRTDRVAQWHALFSPDATGTSVAYRLRKAIRDIVAAEADKLAASSGTVVSPGERETAYQTIVSEYAPARSRPTSADNELAELERLINTEYST